MEFLRSFGSLLFKKIDVIIGIIVLMALAGLVYVNVNQQADKDIPKTSKTITAPANKRKVADDGIIVKKKRVKKGSSSYSFKGLATKIDPGLQADIDSMDLTQTGQVVLSKVETIKLLNLTSCGEGSLGCVNIYNIVDNDTGQYLYSTYEIEVKQGLTDTQRLEVLAHEFLHVVYEELTYSEKQTTNTLLETIYSTYKSDLDRQTSNYDFSNPHRRLHELHSFIGTIVKNIGAELEDHYNDYFSRQSVSDSFYIGMTDTPLITPNTPAQTASAVEDFLLLIGADLPTAAKQLESELDIGSVLVRNHIVATDIWIENGCVVDDELYRLRTATAQKMIDHTDGSLDRAKQNFEAVAAQVEEIFGPGSTGRVLSEVAGSEFVNGLYTAAGEFDDIRLEGLYIQESMSSRCY